MLQSRKKLLENVSPLMCPILRVKTFSKTAPRKHISLPEVNVASYKHPRIRLSLEDTTTLLPGGGGESVHLRCLEKCLLSVQFYQGCFVQDCRFHISSKGCF